MDTILILNDTDNTDRWILSDTNSQVRYTDSLDTLDTHRNISLRQIPSVKLLWIVLGVLLDLFANFSYLIEGVLEETVLSIFLKLFICGEVKREMIFESFQKNWFSSNLMENQLNLFIICYSSEICSSILTQIWGSRIHEF